MTWISSIASQIMDAVSGLFLNALGTDMVTMEEYFPFITKAFDVMQYTAWAVLFLIVVWQLFRAFGGPITEAENPWQLVVRGAIFALLIGYAKPIFMLALDIARAPYTALMDVSMTAEEFTFAGVEQVQDFAKGIGDLPKENVLKFLFTDGSWLAVRPSGTEPKIKVYYSIVDSDKAAAHSRLAALQAQIKEMIGE